MLFAQNGGGLPVTDSVTVVPGKRYEAGSFHRFMFGDGWRDLWTTPLRAGVLDLHSFDGGLTLVRRGGGLQTWGLRFRSANGRKWKFRSIDKNPEKALPEEMEESLVADIYTDLVSTMHPLGPIAASPLLNAVGILQADPLVCVLPHDSLLGKYYDEFAGRFGTIEQHPDEAEDDSPGFAGSEKIVGGFKLMKRIEEQADDKVDGSEFLKARLMDIYLGDWDRHADQWRWAKYDSGRVEWWKPIPRDRDRAFATYNGPVPTLLEYIVPQWTSFEEEYPPVIFATWSGRFLDRRFLAELTKTEWDSVTTFVASRLTDSVINEAVHSMPSEYIAAAGEIMQRKLRARRDRLPALSDDFFRLVNEIADVYCSDENDWVEIYRLNDDETEVIVKERDKETGLPEQAPLFHKVFNHEYTDEIRVYLLGGDDYLQIHGDVDDGVLLRIEGGEGSDTIADSSRVKGWLLSVLPVPSAEYKTEVYDTDEGNTIHTGPGTYSVPVTYERPETPLEYFEPKQRDRGFDLWWIPVLGYNHDDGLEIGINPILTTYGHRKAPWAAKHSFSASIATGPGGFRFKYDGRLRMTGNIVAGINLLWSQYEITQFYGIGNRTSFNEELYEDDYYDVVQGLFRVHPTLSLPLSSTGSLSLGWFYENTISEGPSFITWEHFGRSFGWAGSPDYGPELPKEYVKQMSAITIGLEWDARDNEVFPEQGVLFTLDVENYLEVFDVEENLTRVNLDLRLYTTNEKWLPFTMALRYNLKFNEGKYPFYKAAFLGGPESLRGYNRNRFAGTNATLVQTELRAPISEVKLLIRGQLGIHAFAETGKISDGQMRYKGTWHPSYGGGLWISYLNHAVVASLTVAWSPEQTLSVFTLGMGF